MKLLAVLFRWLVVERAYNYVWIIGCGTEKGWLLLSETVVAE